MPDQLRISLLATLVGLFYKNMKTRIIQTRFYDDEINEEIDIFGQHLYLYLLTCKHINICGCFQLRDGTLKLESKLNDDQLKSAKSQLEKHHKVFFKDGWVYVVNARKNNNYENSNLNQIACQNEISHIPEKLREYFNSSIDSSMDSTHNKLLIQQSISKSKYHKDKDIDDVEIDLDSIDFNK